MERIKEKELQEKVSKQNELLKECLKINNESVSISNETNKELFKQGEQMDRIEKKLDDVSDDLHKSKWLFRGIKSTFGMIKNIFTSPKKTKRDKNTKEIDQKDSKKKEFKESSVTKTETKTNNGNQIKETNDKIFQNKLIGKEINEQDAILDEIMDSVNQLKNNARVTSDTLDEQNKKLEKIGKKVDSNSNEMDKLNKDMKRYLK